MTNPVFLSEYDMLSIEKEAIEMSIWMLFALAGLYYAMDHMDTQEKPRDYKRHNKEAV